jgi:hypothetical protein
MLTNNKQNLFINVPLVTLSFNENRQKHIHMTMQVM